jgi:Xylose isomerase-like TIM barrel
MRPIGFSTGALAKADFKKALNELEGKPVNSIELSALRYSELPTLLSALRDLPLEHYQYIAVHAPSQFQEDKENEVAHLLKEFVPGDWPIIVHPDTLHDFSVWRPFGRQLAIENMDRRKEIGRTAEELHVIFDKLPEARLCFDIGHARQFDTTMTEAYRILKAYGDRLCQVHVSEVNSASQHDPLSFSAILAFLQVASLISNWIPLIIESRIAADQIDNEISKMREAFPGPISVSSRA